MKAYTPRDFGLRSESFVSEFPEKMVRRAIVNVEALQKRGKTDFTIRHSRDPIVIFNFDCGLEGVVEKHIASGKRIIVAGMPGSGGTRKGKTMFPSYSFARPVPMKGEGRRSVGYLERVKAAAYPIWERFISDYTEFLGSSAGTGVVDTGGGCYGLAKMSFHGMDKGRPAAKDDPYGQKSGDMKAIFQGLITDGYNYDKTVFWIHRLKQEWKNNEPTGGYVMDGYNQVPYEVQFTIRLDKKKMKSETVYKATIRDCRDDSSFDGMEFEGKEVKWPTIASIVRGGEEEEWGS